VFLLANAETASDTFGVIADSAFEYIFSGERQQSAPSPGIELYAFYAKAGIEASQDALDSDSLDINLNGGPTAKFPPGGDFAGPIIFGGVPTSGYAPPFIPHAARTAPPDSNPVYPPVPGWDPPYPAEGPPDQTNPK
jgi:hypothetical protein